MSDNINIVYLTITVEVPIGTSDEVGQEINNVARRAALSAVQRINDDLIGGPGHAKLVD